LDEQEQRDYVRDLARQVAEIAGSERNQRVIKRWKDVNALRKPDRAPVWCCPVGAWSEILPDEALLCTDPWLSVLRERRGPLAYQFFDHVSSRSTGHALRGELRELGPSTTDGQTETVVPAA